MQRFLCLLVLALHCAGIAAAGGWVQCAHADGETHVAAADADGCHDDVPACGDPASLQSNPCVDEPLGIATAVVRPASQRDASVDAVFTLSPQFLPPLPLLDGQAGAGWRHSTDRPPDPDRIALRGIILLI